MPTTVNWAQREFVAGRLAKFVLIRRNAPDSTWTPRTWHFAQQSRIDHRRRSCAFTVYCHRCRLTQCDRCRSLSLSVTPVDHIAVRLLPTTIYARCSALPTLTSPSVSTSAIVVSVGLTPSLKNDVHQINCATVRRSATMKSDFYCRKLIISEIWKILLTYLIVITEK